MKVEVAYATANQQRIIEVYVSMPITVAEAIQQSGILQLFPEIDLAQMKVGIFSRSIVLTALVNAGDRIEIYRPLKVDPKEARLLRLRKKKT